MTTPTLGSLCSGAGLLDLGIEAAVGPLAHAWHAEIDEAASRVLAAHWPTVPNLGDLTKVDWASVPRVDILSAGFPCQDLSLAGRRAGLMPGTRSGVWFHIVQAIANLRPRLIFLENVRGILSAKAHSNVEFHPWCMGRRGGRKPKPALRALGAVLGDLADLGYDARWTTVRASDIGAAHRRERVFIVAYPADTPGVGPWLAGADGGRGIPAAPFAGGLAALVPTPGARLGHATSISPATAARRLSVDGKQNLDDWAALLPTPRASANENRQTKITPSQAEGKHGRSLAAEMCNLPTPRARDWKSGGKDGLEEALLPTPAATRSGRQRSASDGATIRPSLDMAHALFPTPRASDATKGGPNQRGSAGDLMLPSAVQLLPTPTTANSHGNDVNNRGDLLLPGVVQLLPTPMAADGGKDRGSTAGFGLRDTSRVIPERWGQYAPAIARWEAVVGRPAPEPTEPGTKEGANRRLAALFVEWLMGTEQGWVCDHVARNDALRILGNGVVWQQAAIAYASLGAAELLAALDSASAA